MISSLSSIIEHKNYTTFEWDINISNRYISFNALLIPQKSPSLDNNALTSKMFGLEVCCQLLSLLDRYYLLQNQFLLTKRYRNTNSMSFRNVHTAIKPCSAHLNIFLKTIAPAQFLIITLSRHTDFQ